MMTDHDLHLDAPPEPAARRRHTSGGEVPPQGECGAAGPGRPRTVTQKRRAG